VGQLTPTDQRDIPYHTASCSAIKAGGREEEFLELWCFSSQVTVLLDEALLSWRWLNTSLLIGSSKLTPCFALCK